MKFNQSKDKVHIPPIFSLFITCTLTEHWDCGDWSPRVNFSLQPLVVVAGGPWQHFYSPGDYQVTKHKLSIQLTRQPAKWNKIPDLHHRLDLLKIKVIFYVIISTQTWREKTGNCRGEWLLDFFREYFLFTFKIFSLNLIFIFYSKQNTLT